MGVKLRFTTNKLAEEKGFKNDNPIEESGVVGPIQELKDQSDLQKWLREEHDIHLVIQYSKHWKGYQWRYDDWRNRNDNPNMKRNSYDEFKTYEDALDAALIEALNLL